MLASLQKAEALGGRHLVEAALTYFFTVGEVQDSEAFLKTIQTHLSPETGESIMTIAQQIEAKGKARGEAIGIAKGRVEGEVAAKRAIAIKLLKQGLSVKAVAQITEVSVQEVRSLLKTTESH